MALLYAVGGRQRPRATERTAEWHQFGAAVIASVDMDTGRLESCVEYVSPSEVCAEEDPSIVFKSATIVGSELFVPTQTEVLVYDLPSFTRSRYVSLPCFNDVHHVRPGADGTLVVANTGLDMVLEISSDDSVRREWSVTGEDIWTRFSKDIDYRRILSTKPHRSHPNHVFYLDGELWVTRCDQHDVLCLTREQAPIRVADTAIHDGLVHGDNVYLTVVSGEIVIIDALADRVHRRIDLNEIAGEGPPLGWCRGIEVLDDDHVIVAFSRLRPTKWRQNVRWAKHRLGGSGIGLLPTRLVMVDLRRERFCWEADLEPAGVNAVFSVHRG